MTRFDPYELADEVRDSDVLVIGTGVAGLTVALASLPRRVTVLTKTGFGRGGSSPWAQGGIAAAVGITDSPRLHAFDTLEAGAGLCDPRTVASLTEEGPERVRELIELGARFDRGSSGELSLGREGAHSRHRILHADGDATGAEIVRALREAVARQPSIEIFEGAAATDLVRQDHRIVGVLARHGTRTIFHRCPAVVLATGGFGQLYAKTTNPVENTGDGLALAARAGARLIDLEFVQFHPTAMDVDADPLPLVTEALRGEGATLWNDLGERFMLAIHPDAELAPRDVVARALWAQQSAGRRVLLDTREAVGDDFPERFPTVWAHCQNAGLDPRREPIPVTPAAHYSMAGVEVDANGRTSLDGLWACGEVSASGVHGANRLASNSLLEALVFGHRVAVDVGHAGSDRPANQAVTGVVVREDRALDESERNSLRQLMWRNVGLLRDRSSLEITLDTLNAMATDACGAPVEITETQNLWTLARLVTSAALVREESRGSHFRSDFPDAAIEWRRRLAWTYRGTGSNPLVRAFDSHVVREIA